jgi:hypothetical protein
MTDLLEIVGEVEFDSLLSLSLMFSLLLNL